MAFAASYRGVCGNCGEEFPPDTSVQYVNDELHHVECPVPSPPRPTCPACRLEIPVSGECC